MAGGVSVSVGEGAGVKVLTVVVMVEVGVELSVVITVSVLVGVSVTVTVLVTVGVSVPVGVLVGVSVVVIVVLVPVAVEVEVIVIVDVPSGVFVKIVVSPGGVGVSLGYSSPQPALPQRASTGIDTKYRLPFSSTPSSSVITVGLLAPTRIEPSSSACAPHLSFALSSILASTNSTRLVSGLTYEYRRTVFSPILPLISLIAS